MEKEQVYRDVVVNDLNQKITERVTAIAKYLFTTTVLNGDLRNVLAEVFKPVVTEGVTEHVKIGDINYEQGMLRVHQFPYDESLSEYIDEIRGYIDSVKVR